MNLAEKFDCIFTRPYSEDDYLLNDYIDYIIHRISIRAFSKQEEFVHMANEMPNGIPQLKDEALDFLAKLINDELGSLRNYLLNQILISYFLSDVDLGTECEEWLREELGDELFEELVLCRKKIVYSDYRAFLNKNRTIDLLKRQGREDFIQEDQ